MQKLKLQGEVIRGWKVLCEVEKPPEAVAKNQQCSFWLCENIKTLERRVFSALALRQKKNYVEKPRNTAKDLTNQQFREYLVLERDYSKTASNALWKCRNTETGEIVTLASSQSRAFGRSNKRASAWHDIPPVGLIVKDNWKVVSKAFRAPNKDVSVTVRCLKCGSERIISIRALHTLTDKCINCYLQLRKERAGLVKV